MSKLIVVVGATGIQGSSVVNTFLETPGWKIRGITRDTSKPTAAALAAKGVEVVQGDLGDKQSIIDAFRGATAIFAVTDFWAPIFSPAANAEAAKLGVPINQYAYDLEVEHGMNIAAAASEPSVLETLTHFVFSALANSKRLSKGKYTKNLHFDSKGVIVERIREEYPDLAKTMSTVQIGSYLTNWKLIPMMGPQKKPDGTYALKVAKLNGQMSQQRTPYLDAGKDTGHFVRGLIRNPPGKHMLGVNTELTEAEFMKLWTETLGVKGGVEEGTLEELTGAMPPSIEEELQDTLNFIREFGWTGGDESVVMPKELGVELPPNGIVDYIKNEDWSPILNKSFE